MLDYDRLHAEYCDGEELPEACHDALALYVSPRAKVIFGDLLIVVDDHEDPYTNVAELVTDVRSGVLKLGPSPCKEEGTHPTWSRDQYIAYRAWHDVEGHFAQGAAFDRYGELVVLRAHVHALTSAKCRLSPEQAAGAVAAVFNEVLHRVACGVVGDSDRPHRPTRLGEYGRKVVEHLAAI